MLVTSLVPHLIKNVELNIHTYEQINFFEHNSIWGETSASESTEHKSLAGLFFGCKDKDFYDYKAKLAGMFELLDLPVVWAKCQGSVEPWFDQLQVADLIIDGIKVGRAGTLSAMFIKGVVKGKGFAFELNTDLLVSYPVETKQFKAWSRYQAVSVDISMLVDASQSADVVAAAIKKVDTLIDHVELVDFFEKESWGDKRSLTMRYKICDFDQNVTKDVIDAITEKVQQAMVHLGGQVR